VGRRPAGIELTATEWPADTIGTQQQSRDFVSEPHTAIVGQNQGILMNLVDSAARPAQSAMLEIVQDKPENVLSAARHLADACAPRSS
jgi:hypothetical protein